MKLKLGVLFLLLSIDAKAQVRQGQQATDINIVQYLGSAFSPTNPLPVQVTNNTPTSFIAVKCINGAGNGFESCAGAGGGAGGTVNISQMGTDNDVDIPNPVTVNVASMVPVDVNSLPSLINTTIGTSLAVRCVTADASAFESCAGAGGGGGGTVAISQTTTDNDVDANITNANIAVTGTFWQATQPVSFGALPAGTNNIGDVDVLTLPAINITNTAFGITQTGTNNDVDVLTLPAIPAGTNNIGDVDVLTLPSIPAGNNNIGDVDIATIPTVTINAIPAGTNNIGDVDVLTLPNVILSQTGTANDVDIATAIPAGNNNIGDVDVLTLPSIPTGANVIGALTANQSVNVAQVGGTNTVNGGLAGSQAIGGTAGNNAAINQNPILEGCEALSAVPTVATTGNQRRCVSDLAGNRFNVYPFAWTCNLQALAAALTQCQAVPGAGFSLYVTQIVATTTTTTAGTFAVRYGTGTNCATAPIGVWPQPGGAGPTRVTTAPISTAAPMQITFGVTGFKVAANNAICVIGTATNTIDISISGYTAP